MVAQTKPAGPASLRVALRDLSQAVRLVTSVLRQIHPGTLVGDLELAVEKRLRAVEHVAAMSD